MKSRSGSRHPRRRHQKNPGMAEQAKRWIAARANRGCSKASGKSLRSDRTVQRYTGDLMRAALWIEQRYNVHRLKEITTEHAQAYVEQRRQDKIGARTIQGYALALQTLPQVEALSAPSRRDDLDDKPQQRRAYTLSQIKAIQAELSPAAALATQIIVEAGCRCQDLASIRLLSESPLKRARLSALIPERFLGRDDWVKVKFIGKGGHEYVSSIRDTTAEQLATYRLAKSQPFHERGQANAVCQCYYRIPVGARLSYLWTQASQTVLDKSYGIHGLRHSYAQERVMELQQLGLNWNMALMATSQTMGHYRVSEISTCYLR